MAYGLGKDLLLLQVQRTHRQVLSLIMGYVLTFLLAKGDAAEAGGCCPIRPYDREGGCRRGRRHPPVRWQWLTHVQSDCVDERKREVCMCQHVRAHT